MHKRIQPTRVAVLAWVFAVVLAVPGFLFALYYTHLFDNAAWFYGLRTVRYTELLACGVGMIFGMFYAWLEPETFGEKVVSPAILFVIVLIPFVKPLLDPLDLNQLKDRFRGQVCLQSTFSTCGPASAVTLLRAFGYSATERELARESLTSRGGTEIWYLARALRRRGIGTQVVIRPRIDHYMPSPAIAGVVLPGNAGHFIAIIESHGDRVRIADPLSGEFVGSLQDLTTRYKFTGFFLVLDRPK
ncbi:MAG TPA: cysteine peptidase family C39 domain-containing protein [Candidatus Sulfotelmatobacter sp.]|nr:cysteine peptidase family C39 domain-containing protein [Candidatus Sulfotelmatobacter sp.]